MLSEIREEATAQLAMWWALSEEHMHSWSVENMERVERLSEQWSVIMSKRASALAPRTIEDLRRRLETPLAPPEEPHLWPQRRVVASVYAGTRSGDGERQAWHLSCGHVLDVSHTGSTPHSAHCRECWGSE